MEQQQTPAKSIRKLTICRKYFSRQGMRSVCFPVVTLTGKWLLDQGFKSGQVIDISCENGKLIITPAAEQRFSNI